MSKNAHANRQECHHSSTQESRIFQLLPQFKDILLLIDSNGIIRYVNPDVRRLFGLQPEKLIGSNFGIPMTGDGNALIDILRQNSNMPFLGDMHVNEVRVDDDIWYLLTIENISEQRRFEDFIVREKHRLAAILQDFGDGLIIIDNNGQVELMNSMAEALTGYSLPDAQGKHVETILQIEAGQPFGTFNKFLNHLFRSEKSVDLGAEAIMNSASGETIEVQVVGSGLTDPGQQRNGASLIIRNVSTRRKLEAIMLREDKLQSIGLLASGLAHDMNNLLMGILGNLSLTQICVGDNEEALATLERAEKAVERAKQISHKLLTFSKGGAPVKETKSIVESIRESSGFALSGSASVCQFNFPHNLSLVDFDETQINQVFQNLVTNADQAMPEGGLIEVSAENVLLQTGEVPTLLPGKYVVVAVSDQGVGIPKEKLSRIFDPYFTTKDSGSGLGLAVCYSILRKHGGFLKVESQENVGTTFLCYFPASASQPKKSTSKRKPVKYGGGKILIVDDEYMVAETTRILLEKIGYNCCDVGGSQEAVEVFNEAIQIGEPFDLVILDLTLPGDIGGEEILGLLRQIDPKVKAIVSSGYSHKEVLANYEQYGFNAIAAKPYDLADISHIVYDLIRKSRSNAHSQKRFAMKVAN